MSQSNINAQKLGTFDLPFCKLAEQKEIVRRVEVLFALARQIETRLASASSLMKKLTPSIFAKAFSGELVPTEAELAEADGRASESIAQLPASIEPLPKPVGGNSVDPHRIGIKRGTPLD